MKKVLFLIIVIVAIGAYFALNKTKEEINVFSSDLPLPNNEGAIVGTYSLKDVLDQKKPFSCTFIKIGETSRVIGEIRLSDEGDLRGDFDVELVIPEDAPNQETPRSFATHFIIKDDTSYTWTSLQPVGYKAGVAKSASKNASQEEQAQIVGINDKQDYECKPWNQNLTIFELPSGINFLDL